MGVIAERMLLSSPKMLSYYRCRLDIYNKLNLSFDLFFNEDIINYKDQEYYNIRMYTDLKLDASGKVLKHTIYQERLHNPIISHIGNSNDCILLQLYGELVLWNFSDDKPLNFKYNYLDIISSIYTKKVLTYKQKHILSKIIKNSIRGKVSWMI